MFTIVYRVVDHKGRGYKNRNYRYKEYHKTYINLDSIIRDIASDTNFYRTDLRPLPHQDGINLPSTYYRAYHIFGFSSISQYKNWFTLSERKAGGIVDGRIDIYEVRSNHVTWGGKQVMFDKRKATLIGSVSMDYYDTPNCADGIDFQDDWLESCNEYQRQENI